jgi:peptidoglycan/xylan/chitin deacetylase (PgdA/CDA1 family)
MGKVSDMLMRFLSISRAYTLAEPVYGGLGTILGFHRVYERAGALSFRPNSSLEISTEFLESLILMLLEEDVDIVSLDRVYQILINREVPDRKFVCFTFDDGYRDTYELAYPVFKKYNIPMAIYVIAGERGLNNEIFANYILEEIIRRNSSLKVERDGKTLTYDTASDRMKTRVYNELYSIVQNGRWPELRDEIVQEGLRVEIFSDNFRMSWDDVAAMSQDTNITIGAHTVTHRRLHTLTRGDIVAEISDSISMISKYSRTAVQHFCYPGGGVSREVFEVMTSFGLRTATTTKPGNIFTDHRTHREQLPRLMVTSEDLGRFRLRWSGMPAVIKNRFKRVSITPLSIPAYELKENEGVV